MCFYVKVYKPFVIFKFGLNTCENLNVRTELRERSRIKIQKRKDNDERVFTPIEKLQTLH